MPKARTLEKIEGEIAEGKLGKARERLLGLVTTYPDDLAVRSRLGDVYYALGYPIEAGRWWILEPDPDEVKFDAIRRFVRSRAYDFRVIQRQVKILGDPPSELGVMFNRCRKADSAKSPAAIVNSITDRIAMLGLLFAITLFVYALAALLVDAINWISPRSQSSHW